MATTNTSKRAARPEPKTETQMAFEAYCETLGRPVAGRPSVKRMVLSFTLSLVAGVAALGVGLWAAHMAMYGFYLLSGWAFMSLAIYIVGQLVAILLAMYAAGKVAQYVATGQYATHMESGAAWLRSKFVDTSTFIKHTMLRDRVTVH